MHVEYFSGLIFVDVFLITSVDSPKLLDIVF